MKSLNIPLANSDPLVSTASKMTAKHLVYLQQCADSSNFFKTAFSLGQFWSRDTSQVDCDVIPMKTFAGQVWTAEDVKFSNPTSASELKRCRFQTGGMNYSNQEYNPGPPGWWGEVDGTSIMCLQHRWESLLGLGSGDVRDSCWLPPFMAGSHMPNGRRWEGGGGGGE